MRVRPGHLLALALSLHGCESSGLKIHATRDAGAADSRPQPDLGRLADGPGAADVPPEAAASLPVPSSPCDVDGGTTGFELCAWINGGLVSSGSPDSGGFSVAYPAPWTIEATWRSGAYLSMWGQDRLLPGTPYAAQGGLVRLPLGLGTDWTWICAGSGSVFTPDTNRYVATLSSLSTLPPCNGAGGSDSLHFAETGVVNFDHTDDGCSLYLTIAGRLLRLFAPTCPSDGVPMPLAGSEIAYRDGPGSIACVGPAASLTWTKSPNGFDDQLVLDIPSMSAPTTCPGVALAGEINWTSR
jgi:hypothetical protein